MGVSRRLNAISKQLQKVDVDVYTVLELYDLIIRLGNLKPVTFKEYEEKNRRTKKKTKSIGLEKTVYFDEHRDR